MTDATTGVTVLIVEDDAHISGIVADCLGNAGYVCTQAFSGTEARLVLEAAAARGERFDVVVCDLMLPGLPGEDIVRLIRTADAHTPIVVTSARTSATDKVNLLKLGADDYLAKPFATEELLARIRALSRRPVQWESTRRLTVGDLELDTELCALRGPGSACSLSKREGQLLELFLRNSSQTMTRELLLARVWGPDAPVEDGNLDNYIHFLRRRLAAAGSAVKIVTARGVGYRLEVPPC